jgi:hypothetical protein
MLCHNCAESLDTSGSEESSDSNEAESSEKRRRRSRSDQLCSRCGELLGPTETEIHARRKKSQLEKFGLAGTRRLLRKRKDRRR